MKYWELLEQAGFLQAVGSFGIYVHGLAVISIHSFFAEIE